MLGTAHVATLSNNASGGFVILLGDQARGVVVTQVFPSERAVNYPVVKEAMELARAKNIADLTPAMVEGFVSAKVLVSVPPALVALIVMLVVAAPVGVPLMTPVVALMLSPGGKPLAE